MRYQRAKHLPRFRQTCQPTKDNNSKNTNRATKQPVGYCLIADLREARLALRGALCDCFGNGRRGARTLETGGEELAGFIGEDARLNLARLARRG